MATAKWSNNHPPVDGWWPRGLRGWRGVDPPRKGTATCDIASCHSCRRFVFRRTCTTLPVNTVFLISLTRSCHLVAFRGNDSLYLRSRYSVLYTYDSLCVIPICLFIFLLICLSFRFVFFCGPLWVANPGSGFRVRSCLSPPRMRRNVHVPKTTDC